MANIASLLKAQLATPDRILYRQFADGAWRDYTAREIAAYAARWQTFFRAERFERELRRADTINDDSLRLQKQFYSLKDVRLVVGYEDADFGLLTRNG